MFGWLERKARLRRTGRQLYESIVAQARAELFYRDLGVADTIEGHFELIVLHMVLVLRRLKGEGDLGQRVGQIVMEHLIADMDDALRQIGIGDMGVPRRVQRAAAALEERSRDYGSAAGKPADMARAVLRHVYGDPIPPSSEASRFAERLARYVCESEIRIEATPRDALLEGRLPFADISPAGI